MINIGLFSNITLSVDWELSLFSIDSSLFFDYANIEERL